LGRRRTSKEVGHTEPAKITTISEERANTQRFNLTKGICRGGNQSHTEKRKQGEGKRSQKQKRGGEKTRLTTTYGGEN